MIAVGFLLTWAGYSVGLWGWCLLRGYDVTLGQLMSPMHPYGTGKGQTWPPPLIPDTQVFPGKAAASSSAPSSPASSSAPSTGGTPSGKIGPGGTVVKLCPPRAAGAA